jgi:hypothetical protein
MVRTLRWLVAALALSTTMLAGTARAQGEAATAPASQVTPGKALALSVVPGLGQHYLGEHGKAYWMEGVCASGLVVLLASSSGSSHDDGSGGYTPPEYSPPTHGSRSPLSSVASGGNGDDNGSSAGTFIGAALLAGGIAWSLIDAPMTAQRRIQAARATSPEAPPTSAIPEEGPALGVAVVPLHHGLAAGLSIRF